MERKLLLGIILMIVANIVTLLLVYDVGLNSDPYVEQQTVFYFDTEEMHMYVSGNTEPDYIISQID